MFCNGLLGFLPNEWEKAAVLKTQVCGFLILLNLQHFYINLRRSPQAFKMEAMSNAISSQLLECELFQSSYKLSVRGPELGWVHLGFPFLE